jgi:SAM-dependent methyltransferase
MQVPPRGTALMADTAPSPLVLSEAEIGRYGPGNLLLVCLRQWRAERNLARRGIHFRSTNPRQVAAAYRAMTAPEFDAINGRQDWANWRTIPRCLGGHVPDRPLRILDLGCGTGSSTRVLAFCAPPDSHVIGYELAEPLIAIARTRMYSNRCGRNVRVEFRCQGVTETFGQTDGSTVPDGSIDVVNSSGVVGHHLSEQTVHPLLAEMERVLAKDGMVMLDVGPSLREPALTRLMGSVGFGKVGHWCSCWIDPTGQVVYRRQAALSGARHG